MPFIDSLPQGSSPLQVYRTYPELYGPWSDMSEALMNGPSPFDQAQRELLFSYAAGVAGCDLVCIAHSEVAYARGVPRGTVEALIADPVNAQVIEQLRPAILLLRKLMLLPHSVEQSDVTALMAAGWNEQALNHVIAIAGRAAFMQRMVAGYGLVPLSRDQAAAHAHKRIQMGYADLMRKTST